ncbi:MAG: ABC transporter ATP-binding protein [Pseudomonadota bacterium]|nr:ABC transporter ATP-binding protein [Pseudomonadota bacterium]
MALLDIRNLTVGFDGPAGRVDLVRNVNLQIRRGEILGLLGESGSGKSLTAMAVLGLLPSRMKISGEILFQGTDLLGLSEAKLCKWRGNKLAMVFQEPLTALNPAHTIGRQVAEPLRLHKRLSRRQAHAAAVDLLARVGLPRPAERAGDFPHQLSGGQRQRVVIAIALACDPSLIIADEPTTALDTLVQRQIIELLVRLVEDMDAAMVLITHDVGLLAETADRVRVMYSGSIVESGPYDRVFEGPAHPYTRMLLQALPQGAAGTGAPLRPIPGRVPPPDCRPTGCSFRDRCPQAQADCERTPVPVELEPGHEAACLLLPQVVR